MCFSLERIGSFIYLIRQRRSERKLPAMAKAEELKDEVPTMNLRINVIFCVVCFFVFPGGGRGHRKPVSVIITCVVSMLIRLPTYYLLVCVCVCFFLVVAVKKFQVFLFNLYLESLESCIHRQGNR